MSILASRSITLKNNMNCPIPPLVFHYTSANGAIGILASKEMWATNVSFLNDEQEIIEVINGAKHAIGNMIERNNYSNQELNLLNEMRKAADSAARRCYVMSFSEDEDSLLHWQAYCPNPGGYAIGFPSKHLSNLAREQGWYFVKCVYDHNEKYRIVSEIITSYIEEFRELYPSSIVHNNLVKDLSWQFAQYLAQIGVAVKHEAFSREAEWRIISPQISDNDTRIGFRPGFGGVVPYYRFPLITENHPNLARHENQNLVLRCGPTNERRQAQFAAQMILERYLNGAACAISDVPLRRV